jgi:hypothetical protein
MISPVDEAVVCVGAGVHAGQPLKARILDDAQRNPILGAQLLQLCHHAVRDVGDALGVQTVHHALDDVHLVLDGKVHKVRVHWKRKRHSVSFMRKCEKINTLLSVAGLADRESGAFLNPGSGIRNRFFPDPESQAHILESLVTIFWVKSSTIN